MSLEKMSWREITEADPRLKMLFEMAENIKDDQGGESFCANTIWYGYSNYPIGLKSILVCLVGWGRVENAKKSLFEIINELGAERIENAKRTELVEFEVRTLDFDDSESLDAPESYLETSEAYSFVYDKIYNALPNCRNCAC